MIRLNALLPKIISSWQTGFVPSRDIVDNIMLVQELSRDLDRHLLHPNLMLKLDMEKAYDQVEWAFLLFMVHKFGFQEMVVGLFFRTLCNSWFSISVNRELASFLSRQEECAKEILFPQHCFLLWLNF